MSNKKSDRVLGRQAARELTQEEIEGVAGAHNTLTICTFDPKTGIHDCDVNDNP